MTELLHELVTNTSKTTPSKTALRFKDTSISYYDLNEAIEQASTGLLQLGLSPNERVAIYLPKLPETVTSIFACSRAGGCFVPINPLLKPQQVQHILKDSGARVLITSNDRHHRLKDAIDSCHDLSTVILVNANNEHDIHSKYTLTTWTALNNTSSTLAAPPRISTDMAAILYTSGSTGKPKGVVLSHQNVVTGAKSVASYLENDSRDRILTALPLSFDYGFSQLTTAFYAGATIVLMDYLTANDIVKKIKEEKITGLAGVPTLWNQITTQNTSAEDFTSLRYITNSGSALPQATLNKLRSLIPQCSVYLMYGLTEAFRSTYLPPEEIDRYPNSIGKAIPNVEIMVVRDDGSPCAPGEPGELIHRGALVSLGYWNDPEKTAKRFKPAPNIDAALPLPEIAGWSGDNVKMDENGYLYFIGRRDEMIKTSGYLVSPTEIEEVIYGSKLVNEAVALGIQHPAIDQAIIVVASAAHNNTLDKEALLQHCRQHLPSFMLPLAIFQEPQLPRTPNGKIDRKQLAKQFGNTFVN